MKIDIKEIIEIPQGVEVEVNHGDIKVSANGNENKKKVNLKKISLKKEGNTIIIESKKATKREATMLYTIKAHILNMMKGVQEDFIYKLEVAYVHFPMTAEVSGDKVLIKNFLGEKRSRVCMILKGTKVEISGKEITVTSHDRELGGQMAANLEKATRVRNKDRRKFQDGIYITEKPGRII